MGFGKLVVFVLANVIMSTVSRAEECDIEMFTFYPYHCESNLMKQMKKVFGCDVFIETGTLGGETSFNAAPIFDLVYSVELSEWHFNAAQQRNIYSNVFLYHDSSDSFLDSLLPQIQDKRKLFWLDAHFSGGNTATLIDESTGQPKSPIWGELKAIFKNSLLNSVVLIDDISGYLLDSATDMRYPHLHHQYNLIKKNCKTAQLYIVGDLALVYDSAYHSPSVSPFVQACTISRMFDWCASNFEDEKAVLKAEYEFVQRCHENEAERVCYLSEYCHCRDYRLWRGLIHLGRGDFVQAAKDFQFVIDAGMIHWRVYLYLAYALEKSGAIAQSKSIFSNINVHLKNHEVFLKKSLLNVTMYREALPHV